MKDTECPSIWKCDKCGFQLTNNILCANTGNISQDKSDHLEPCPNDGRDMRRMTWEELFRDAVKVGEQQVKRACDAEAMLSALTRKGTGVDLIATERARQITQEGWSESHDDEHSHGELLMAALTYAMIDDKNLHGTAIRLWPWNAQWLKVSSDEIRNLVKAGALIAAEIDRLKRAQSILD